MPRTLKGEKWEVQYRRDVRLIKDGLTASPNGRGLIKATQLINKCTEVIKLFKEVI